MHRNSTTGTEVAVFGAAGHTGRFVVAELLRRGLTPIAIGRDAATLEEKLPGEGILRRQATLDDASSLARALDGAKLVINCAGPFLDTAELVAAAALRAGIHYLDVTAEQPSASDTLARFDAPARGAGVAVIPAMGFYGGLADLLATAATGDGKADAIEIMIGLDSWHPTRGTRITGDRNTAQRLIVSGGQLAPLPRPTRDKSWDFSGPLGHQPLVELPFSEVVLIAHHIRTAELRTWLSSAALSDLRNPATPAPQAADEAGRSEQRFQVDIVVTRDGERRRASARGRDIYAVSAPLVCEAAQRLLEGRFAMAGARPPGAVFDASSFLAALAPDHLEYELG
jgi:hypothetical protein